MFFGIGTGLTLDEFALWLNLKDVYWEKQGRKSIDAVIIAAAVSGVLLISLRSWIDADDAGRGSRSRPIVGAIGLLGVILALVNAAKEKFGMALWSVLIPVVGLVGAFRLAKPNSVWAKLFYRHGKKERSEERYSRQSRASRSGSGAASYSLRLGLRPQQCPGHLDSTSSSMIDAERGGGRDREERAEHPGEVRHRRSPR